jgi:hypothetical protein
MTIKIPTRKVFLPKLDRHAHFTDRTPMKGGHPVLRRYKLYNGENNQALPPATLPIDWTKGGTINYPYDDNDTLGDCEYAAAEHQDNTWTGNVGPTQSVFNDTATKEAYLALSGGDNGLDNGTMIGAWESAGLAGNADAKILDALDIDPTNAPMVASAMFEFGGVQFQLAVPTAWINNFKTGYIWDAGPGIVAVEANGHAIHWPRILANGNYGIETWGTYGEITPAGVKVCDPTAFVCFSLRWFNAQGYAPNGRHITQSAALWLQAGGKQIPASIINSYPPPTGPVVPPTPVTPTVGPTPAPTPTPGPTPTPSPTPAPGTVTEAQFDAAVAATEAANPHLVFVIKPVAAAIRARLFLSDGAKAGIRQDHSLKAALPPVPPALVAVITAALDAAGTQFPQYQSQIAAVKALLTILLPLI